MTKQLFTHQDHVIDSGEMEVIGSSEHCEIAVCKHPTRPIQISPVSSRRLSHLYWNFSVECGDMTSEERSAFGNGKQDLDVTDSLISPKY